MFPFRDDIQACCYIIFTLVEVNSFAWSESPIVIFEVIKIIILSKWVSKAVKLSNIKIEIKNN